MNLYEYAKNFNDVKKRILKKNLSRNIQTLNGYKIDIVKAYNELTVYCARNFLTYEANRQNILKATYKQIRSKLILCLNKLGCSVTIPNLIFYHIDINTVSGPIVHGQTNEFIPNIDEFDCEVNLNSELSEPEENFEGFPELLSEEQIPKMATIEDALKLSRSILTNDYTGNALELESFINKLNLLSQVAPQAHIEIVIA